jgi:hypothetical protein
MCSSTDSSLDDLAADMILVPGRPTNCAEVIGLRLLATLRQPECERLVVSNLWDIYALLRFTSSPGRHKRLLASLLKDLPREVRVDLAREAWYLTDAGSELLLELLGCGLAARSQWTCGFPHDSRRQASGLAKELRYCWRGWGRGKPNWWVDFRLAYALVVL